MASETTPKEVPTSGRLTPRQQEVLALTMQGKSNCDIAQELGLSVNTVRVHLALVFKALGVSSRVEATLAGLEHLNRRADELP